MTIPVPAPLFITVAVVVLLEASTIVTAPASAQVQPLNAKSAATSVDMTKGIPTFMTAAEDGDVIVPPPGSCGLAKDRMTKPDPDTKCLDWFMCLKKCPNK